MRFAAILQLMLALGASGALAAHERLPLDRFTIIYQEALKDLRATEPGRLALASMRKRLAPFALEDTGDSQVLIARGALQRLEGFARSQGYDRAELDSSLLQTLGQDAESANQDGDQQDAARKNAQVDRQFSVRPRQKFERKTPSSLYDFIGDGSQVAFRDETPGNPHFDIIDVRSQTVISQLPIPRGLRVAIKHLPGTAGDFASFNEVTGRLAYHAPGRKSVTQLRIPGLEDGKFAHLVSNPDGKRVLISIEAREEVYVVDLNPRGQSPRVRKVSVPNEHAQFSPDGKHVGALNLDGTLRIWSTEDLATPPRIETYSLGDAFPASGNAVDAQWIVTSDELRVTDTSESAQWVTVFDRATGLEKRRYATPRIEGHGLLSADGRIHFFYTPTSPEIRIWEVDSGRVARAKLPRTMNMEDLGSRLSSGGRWLTLISEFNRSANRWMYRFDIDGLIRKSGLR
jgi:hypothetical protein